MNEALPIYRSFYSTRQLIQQLGKGGEVRNINLKLVAVFFTHFKRGEEARHSLPSNPWFPTGHPAAQIQNPTSDLNELNQ